MSTTETEELVTRLLKPETYHVQTSRDDLGEPYATKKCERPVDPLRKEAADRLVSLQGEVERLKQDAVDFPQALAELGVTPDEARRGAERSRQKTARIAELEAQVERLSQPSPETSHDGGNDGVPSHPDRAGCAVPDDAGLRPVVESEAAQPSPAGWQLVPIEPTREHYERYAGDRFTSFRRWSEVYHDMLVAAPSAPPQASHPSHRVGDDKSEYGHEG
jgi:hypothetical protein